MGLEKQIKKANLRVYVIGLTYAHKKSEKEKRYK